MTGPMPLAVPYEQSRVQYALAASPPSTYAIPWKFWTLDQDLAVQVQTLADGVIHILAYGTDFTVLGNPPADPNNSFYDGGTLTLSSPSSWASSQLTLWRLPHLVRTTNISPTGPLDVRSLNAQLDELATTTQDIWLRLDSDYGRRYTELGNDFTVRFLPTPNTGKVLGWSGQEIVNIDPASFGGTGGGGPGPTGPTGPQGLPGTGSGPITGPGGATGYFIPGPFTIQGPTGGQACLIESVTGALANWSICSNAAGELHIAQASGAGAGDKWVFAYGGNITQSGGGVTFNGAVQVLNNSLQVEQGDGILLDGGAGPARVRVQASNPLLGNHQWGMGADNSPDRWGVWDFTAGGNPRFQIDRTGNATFSGGVTITGQLVLLAGYFGDLIATATAADINVGAHATAPHNAQLSLTVDTGGKNWLVRDNGSNNNLDFYNATDNVLAMTITAAGVPSINATPSPGDNSTKIATTAFVAAAVAGGGSVAGTLLKVTRYATAGTFTFTPLAATTKLIVEMWGPAGGGGSTLAASAGQNAIANGGGGGGYGKALWTSNFGTNASPVANGVVVGTHGAGGSGGGNGGAGSPNTSFTGTGGGSQNVGSGQGGGAGFSAAPPAFSTTTPGAGGAAGTVTGTGPTLIQAAAGQSGEQSFYLVAGTVRTTKGGAPGMGPPGSDSGQTTASTAGSAASAPGQGGGGAASPASGAAAAGGNGGDGQVIIWEYS